MVHILGPWFEAQACTRVSRVSRLCRKSMATKVPGVREIFPRMHSEVHSTRDTIFVSESKIPLTRRESLWLRIRPLAKGQGTRQVRTHRVRVPRNGSPRGPISQVPGQILGCFRVSGAPYLYIRMGPPIPDIDRSLRDPEFETGHIVTKGSQSPDFELRSKAFYGKEWPRPRQSILQESDAREAERWVLSSFLGSFAPS